CSGSSSYAPRSYLRPIQPIRNRLLQTLIRQSESKCLWIEQPKSYTHKERKHSPNFVSVEANGLRVIPTFLLTLPMARWSSTRPSRHARDAHTTEQKIRRGG